MKNSFFFALLLFGVVISLSVAGMGYSVSTVGEGTRTLFDSTIQESSVEFANIPLSYFIRPYIYECIPENQKSYEPCKKVPFIIPEPEMPPVKEPVKLPVKEPEPINGFPVKQPVTIKEQAPSITIVKQGQETYHNTGFSSVFVAQDIISAGETTFLIADFENGGSTLRDIRITMSLPELGVRYATSEFTIRSGKQVSEPLLVQIPYGTSPGMYTLKIAAHNSRFHEVAYRQITVR